MPLGRRIAYSFWLQYLRRIHRVEMRTTKQSGKAPQQAFQRGLAIAAAVAAMAGTAACTSAVAQSPAAPPTAIAPIAAAAPVPALTATVGQTTTTAASTSTAASTTVRAEGSGTSAASSSTVQELQRRMQAHELSELRTTYNGAYGASLLFAQSDLTYYVTLFQQKDLWRVVKTTNEAAAERAYNDFAKQTRTMADLELQRIRLEAQKERAERQIAAQQEKLRGLRTDLDIQRQQQAQAQERQKVARAEAEALDIERRAARAHVDELQRQIRELEAQVNAPFNSHQRRR